MSKILATEQIKEKITQIEDNIKKYENDGEE